MIGSNYPYAEFLPETGQARGVQIDLSSRHLSLRYPMEVNLAGDAKATLTALLPHLTQQTDHSWQEQVIDGMKDWNEVTEAEAMAKADPINPRDGYHLLNQRLPANSIVTADAGSTADWYGHHIKLGRDMRGNLSGMLASMLAAMPYAVAAKFAHPDRPVVCTIGDGAFQMLGMNEMLTVKRHWKTWDDPRFIVLVLNNGDLSQVSWEMREVGDPRYDTSQLVEDMDYAGYAEVLGLRGIKVDQPDQVADAWDAAFAADRPVVLDVHTDPNVPPLPAHISFDEAKGFLATLRKGDPAETSVIRNSLRAVGAELFANAKNALSRDKS
jgi:pyruvate dehydrogenase (quinone)